MRINHQCLQVLPLLNVIRRVRVYFASKICRVVCNRCSRRLNATVLTMKIILHVIRALMTFLYDKASYIFNKRNTSINYTYLRKLLINYIRHSPETPSLKNLPLAAQDTDQTHLT